MYRYCDFGWRPSQEGLLIPLEGRHGMVPYDDERDVLTVDPKEESAPLSGVLHGWKDIAGYLGMSVRTVQRWEHEFGLPIRRFCPGPGQPVHALVAEVDAWRSHAESASHHREVFEHVGTGGTRQAATVSQAAERSARKKTAASGMLKTLVAGLAAWIGK